MANAFTLFGEIKVNTSGFKNDLRDAEKSLKQTESQLGKTESKARNLGTTISTAGAKMSAAGKAMTAAITLPIIGLGAAAVATATKFDSLKRGLTAVAGSSAEAEKQLVRLREVAKLPGLGLTDAIQGSINLQAAGISAQLAERSLKAFGNALATVGKGKAELDGVTTALTQIVSKGKISAEEINQLAERLPQIRVAMKDAFGTSNTEELQKMGIDAQTFIDKVVAQFEKLPQVTGGAANMFENAVDTMTLALLPLGEAILKAITPIIEFAVPIIEKLGQMFANLGQPAQLAIIVIAGIAAALGPLLIVAGTVAGAIGSLVTAFTAITAVVSIGPILAAIAAILATVGAAAIALTAIWVTNFGGMRDHARLIANTIKTAWDSAMNSLKELFAQVLAQITEFWKENGADIMAAVKVTSDAIKQIWQGALKAIAAFWQAHGAEIKAIASAAWAIIGTVVKAGVQVILNVIKLVAALINNDWSSAWDAAKAIVGVAMSAMASITKNGIRIIGNILLGIAKMVLGIIPAAAAAARALGVSIVEGVSKGITDNLDKVKGAVSQLMQYTVIGRAASLLESKSPSKVFMRLGRDVVMGFVLGLENGRSLVSATLDSIFGDAISKLEASIAKKLKPKEAKQQAAEERVGLLTGKLKELQNLFVSIGLIREITPMERLWQLLRDGDLTDQVKQFAEALGYTVAQFEMLIKHKSALIDITGPIGLVPGIGGFNKRDIPDDSVGLGMSDKQEKEQIERFKNVHDAMMDALGKPPKIELPNIWNDFWDGLNKRMEEFKNNLPSLKEALGENIMDALYGIGDVFGRSIQQWDGTLQGFFKSVAQGFGQMAKQIIADLVRILIYKAILSIFSAVAGSAGGGTITGAGGVGHAGPDSIGSRVLGGLSGIGGGGGGSLFSGIGGFGLATAGAGAVNNLTTNTFAPTINMQASGNSGQDRQTAAMIQRQVIKALREEQRKNR